MNLQPVYIESVGYLTGHGDEQDACLDLFARESARDDAFLSAERLRDAGLERRLRSQISEHALLAVLAAKRCVSRVALSQQELSSLALFMGVPSGSEVSSPFVEAMRGGLAENPALSRADIFEQRSINVLELLRLSTGNTAGHVARALGLHGANACYIGGRSSFFALSRGYHAIASGSLTRAMVVGGESTGLHESKVHCARAGCAMLLTAEEGVGRAQLTMPPVTGPAETRVAPFEHFESLNTLLNLAWLLEQGSRAATVMVAEPSDGDIIRSYGVRRANPPEVQVGRTRLCVPPGGTSMRRRVVVTAVGVVSPLAIGFRALTHAIFEGQSAAQSLPAGLGRGWTGLPVRIAAPVRGFVPRRLQGVAYDELERSSLFALEALAQIADTVDLPMLRALRAPLYCGVGAAQALLDFDEVQRLCAGHALQPRRSAQACETSANTLRHAFHLTGDAQTLAGACSASTQACIQAVEEIRTGQHVAVLAGGHDSLLSVPGLYMMHELGTLAMAESEPSRAIRPFDRDRDGTMVGEGAVYFLFEELSHAQARGGQILAEVSGWGSSLDGYHTTSPDPEGTHGAAMIEAALSLAELDPARVDYVNAHGTATLLNDATEALILRRALRGHRPWVSSSKPQLGHLIAACGAAELAVCVAALLHQRLPPNLNFETPDPECDLKLVTQAGPASLEHVLSLSFGFGGQNSCLLLKRFTRDA